MGKNEIPIFFAMLAAVPEDEQKPRADTIFSPHHSTNISIFHRSHFHPSWYTYTDDINNMVSEHVQIFGYIFWCFHSTALAYPPLLPSHSSNELDRFFPSCLYVNFNQNKLHSLSAIIWKKNSLYNRENVNIVRFLAWKSRFTRKVL